MARILPRTRWVIIDEALESLEEDTLMQVIEVLGKDLARSGIIHIGRVGAYDHLFTRVLHLIKDPSARRLIRPAAAEAAAEPAALGV